MNSAKRKKPAEAAENPFEAKWAVLAGTARKRAAAAATSAARSSRNVFADRRIAEDDPSVPEEDRYLARLQRERTRRSRKRARFSLLDNDEDADDGADPSKPSFSLLRDDYDDAEGAADKGDEDADDGSGDASDDELLKLKQSGGHEDADGGHPRTHREIMDEVVLKSKMYKAQRQQEKHDVDEQTAKLDEDLPGIIAMIYKSSSDYSKQKARETGNDSKAVPRAIFSDDGDAGNENAKNPFQSPPSAPGAQGSDFHYEKVYQQLAAEKRSKPSNRLLTETEKAEQEMDELKQLEAKRRRRMQSVDSEDEDEADSGKGGHRKKSKQRQLGRKEKHSGGDDLDDDFDLLESEDSDPPGSNEESDSENESDVQPGPSRTGETDEQKAEDSGNGRVVEFNADSMVFPKPYEPKVSDDNIPYVYRTCPSKTKQLQDLFKDMTVDQRGLILERIRKCFAVSLHPTSNPGRLDALLQCLLERIEILSNASEQNIEGAVKEIDMVLGHVHSLGKSREARVSAWAKDRLAESFFSLTNAKNKEDGLSCRWDVSTILVLRAIGHLFPSSDMRHPVSTPLALLLSEAVEISRMQNIEDIAMGVLVSTVLLEQMVESGRYSGQLARLMVSVVDGAYGGHRAVLRGCLRATGDEETQGEAVEDAGRLNASDCMKKVTTSKGRRELRGKIVRSSLGIIEASGFEGSIKHMDIVYQQLPLRRVAPSELRSAVEREIGRGREARGGLRLYTKGSVAVAAKTLNPKFSAEGGVFRKKPRTSYTARSNGDVSASATRIQRALRKEHRGLARDVRRSALHAAQDRARLNGERAERREKRGREVTAFLEEQQATWKRAEKKQKMLSGKRW